MDESNGALPIAPGESRTLTLGGAYYSAQYSDLSGVSGGEIVYVQVDSFGDPVVLNGKVAESHELSGQPYNNIYGPEIWSSTLSTLPGN